jgi:putative tryptophan/tyrosine transport system substrate-binding protein
MRRRDFITGVGATTATPLAAHALKSGRTYRIAFLGPLPIIVSAFWDELKRNGLVEGRDFIADTSGLGVPVARLEDVAAELVKAHPDAIVTFGPAAGFAAQRATKSIPIVAYTDDLVESGLVVSMLHPRREHNGRRHLRFATRCEAARNSP